MFVAGCGADGERAESPRGSADCRDTADVASYFGFVESGAAGFTCAIGPGCRSGCRSRGGGGDSGATARCR